jgi:predicted metal-dependent hydrolase
MELDQISIGENRYPVYIYFEDRRYSRASIGAKGIYIRIPQHLSRQDKKQQVMYFKKWATDALRKHPERNRPRLHREYRDGDVLTVGDKTYTITIAYKDKKSSSARLQDGRVEFILSSKISADRKPAVMATLLSRCIGQERLPKLQEKIQALNTRYFRQKIGKIAFRHSKSRWGSCSTKGNINLSTRLLFAPDDVLEYVCVHELAHLSEMNHSSRFWALVEKAMPDFRQKELWLKENRNLCWF